MTGYATRRVMNVAWVGPDSPAAQGFRAQLDGLGNSFHISVSHEFFATCDVLAAVQAHADRLVFLSPNRQDYPWSALEVARHRAAPTPFAVLVDEWFDGSRRTGSGVPSHLQAAWYRWWDCWALWFFPEAFPNRVASCLFAPIVDPISTIESQAKAHAAARLDAESLELESLELENLEPRPNSLLLVLAQCPDSATVLASSAESLSIGVRVLESVEDLQVADSSLLETPDWLVMDDSFIVPGTVHQAAGLDERCEMKEKLMEQFWERLASQFPNTQLIFNATCPRYHFWARLQRVGVHDLLVKPSHDLPLRNRLLMDHRRLDHQNVRTAI